jgi:hypothetical protein
MISIVRRVVGLACRELYFCEGIPGETVGEDLQTIVQAANWIPNAEPFFTLIVDLRQDSSTIFHGISKQFIRHIRRAEVRDQVVISVVEKPSKANLETFSRFYDRCAIHRGRAPANRKKLQALARAGNLVLAGSRLPGEGRWLAMHAYVCDGRRARALYSATCIDALPSEQRNQAARGNKLLHWKMMTHFKAAGYMEYDFGGLGKRHDMHGLDRFKMSFGGKEILEYNLVRGVSMPGKIAAFVYHVLLGSEARAPARESRTRLRRYSGDFEKEL